jgi:transposase
MARKAKSIVLSTQEELALTKQVRSKVLSQREVQRARLVLLAADGIPVKEIALRLDMSVPSVRLWRDRFDEKRLDGLKDRPGRGRRPGHTEADRARLIAMVCSQPPPDGATHWTVRSLAAATGMARSLVHNILQQERLQPHRTKTWVTSTDPEFETKAVDVLGLYMRPPENALVLCVDEKTAIQALDRSQPTLPLRPGQVQRRSFEYKRNGITSLYAALAVHQGKVVGQCAPRHSQEEFLAFLRLLARTYPAQELHLILDNQSAHKTEAVRQWLQRHRRFHLHFTPTHASWLNQVEIWFSILSRKVIRRGVFPSVKALIQAIMDFIQRYNQAGKPFQWTYTPERLLTKVI